jgi:hypothetical protein
MKFSKIKKDYRALVTFAIERCFDPRPMEENDFKNPSIGDYIDFQTDLAIFCSKSNI